MKYFSPIANQWQLPVQTPIQFMHTIYILNSTSKYSLPASNIAEIKRPDSQPDTFSLQIDCKL